MFIVHPCPIDPSCRTELTEEDLFSFTTLSTWFYYTMSSSLVPSSDFGIFLGYLLWFLCDGLLLVK